jgi:calcineurin-like phosphoesterase family protein
MTTWFIADTHFFHKNIVAYDRRPFNSMEEHNNGLINNWNERVKTNDLVYHLGDFCFTDVNTQIETRKKLNGEIILIKGNHDPSTNRCKKIFGENNVKNSFTIELCSYELILTHKPRFDITKISNESFWNIHGHEHIHTGQKQKGRNINVNVLFWNYYPVSENQIIKLIKLQLENE